MIDFHTHILPEMDDGSQSVEESIELLKMAYEQGVREVVLTPHFYPSRHQPELFFKKRTQCFQTLMQHLPNTNMPRLLLGAEVHYFSGIGEYEGLKQFTIENTNYVLVEMPMPPWSGRMMQDLEMIYTHLGLIPILAHIDRYISPLSYRSILKQIDQLPILIQANASFFLKLQTKRLACQLLKQERIHILGSDCHNVESRPVNLKMARDYIEKKLGNETLKKIDAKGKDILSSCTIVNKGE